MYNKVNENTNSSKKQWQTQIDSVLQIAGITYSKNDLQMCLTSIV